MIHPKLTLSDIDGTLLNDHQQLMTPVIEAIHNYVDRGGIFCLASARPVKAMDFIANEIGLTVPLATLNGAYITELDQNNTVLFEQPLNPIVAPTISQLVTDHELKISLNIYSGIKWFIQAPNPWSDQEAAITRFKPTVTELKNIYQKCQIHKILCLGEPTEIDRLGQLLAPASELSINAARSKPTYLEVTDRKVSKVSALNHLAAYFQVPLADTMAIGDGDNDLAMVQAAGVGIALANASQAMLKSADHVVKSNNHAGVAEALNKYTK